MPGWAGEAQARNLAVAAAGLDRLTRAGTVPKPPARTLELGCGNGAGTRLLAKIGYDVYGIDLAQTAIAWAVESFAEARFDSSFVTGSVCDMHCFENASFDFVVDGACLHCLTGEDRMLGLSEVQRILRSTGTFVVGSMCGVLRTYGSGLCYDSKRQVLTRDGRDYRIIRNLPDLVEEVSLSGFRVIDVSIAENLWWDHATPVCHRADPPGR